MRLTGEQLAKAIHIDLGLPKGAVGIVSAWVRREIEDATHDAVAAERERIVGIIRQARKDLNTPGEDAADYLLSLIEEPR